MCAVHGRHFDRRGGRDGVHDCHFVVCARAGGECGAICAGGAFEVRIWGCGAGNPVHRVAVGVGGVVEGGGAEGVAVLGGLEFPDYV